LRAWLALGIAAWIELGIVLVDKANSQGLVENISISPYHLFGYAGLAVLAIYVVVTFFRGLRHAAIWSAFPPGYAGLGLGFVAVVAWLVLDPIWSGTLGIGGGIEGSFAPPRLLIPLAVVLLASGPIREAIALRARPGMQPGETAIRWAGVLSVGVLGAALTQPGLNPLRNTLASYATHPNADRSEIWVMRADGSGQTRVVAATGDGIDWSYPAWSPDGSRIVYTQWMNDDGAAANIKPEDQTATIWTMAADGSDRRKVIEVADAQAWIPAWSPDGALLTYSLSQVGAGAVPAEAPGPQANQAPAPITAPGSPAGSSIWISRLDGSEARRVSPEQRDALAGVWSPDGTKLAYHMAGAGDETDVFVSTVEGDRLLFDTEIAVGSSNDWAPAWTPDGRTILFVSDRDGNDEIYSRPADGSGVATRLTDNPRNDWVPAVSPDGTKVAFVSDRSGEPEIWVMAIDGSNPVDLSNNPFGSDGTWSLAWSPDGTSIAYATANYADAASSGWVREDLASAQLILFGIALAVLGILLVALGAPPGSFAAVLTIVALIPAITVDDWRYVPAAVAGGLIVDGLVASVRQRWRSRVAAAGISGIGNLAFLLAIGVGGTLVWSMTLVLGVATISAVLGWALAELVERLGQAVAGAPRRG
jgi:Tol biopolymer transport system component